LIGALLMVGIMADGEFMLGLRIFAGVKVAHLLPVLLIGLWFAFLRPQENPMLKAERVLEAPLTSKYLLIVGIIGAVLGLYLMRTGNETAAVPEWERIFRATLDNLLYVRPRTKEFAFGHPLLLLIIYFGYQDRYLPLLLLASIGQVSLVNTFAHAHTPLFISFLRTANGLFLGIIGGVILILVVKKVGKSIEKRWPDFFLLKKPSKKTKAN
ncbi:MAG: DUF5693 family protein, partial [Clostridiales bacterium]